MIGRHILGELPIEILEADHKLGNRFMWFLCNSVELLAQFLLRYLVVEKFEESITNILKRRKFPEIIAEIPHVAGPSRDNVNSIAVRHNIECGIQHRGHLYIWDMGMAWCRSSGLPVMPVRVCARTS